MLVLWVLNNFLRRKDVHKKDFLKKTYVLKKDFLILGDTSHSIHPVAGQGWNLGVKDIQTLCDNLLKYDIENPNFDNLYASNRIIENIGYLFFTNFLNIL